MSQPSAFDSAVASASEQFDTVLSAPIPFFLILAVLCAAIWKFVSHLKANKIENLEGQIGSKDALIAWQDAQLTDYKDKLSGATPDEALARIEALEQKLTALGPRRLSERQKEIIERIASRSPGALQISCTVGTRDGEQYRDDLVGVFRAAGWDAKSGSIGTALYPRSGMAVYIRKEGAVANVFVAALNEAAIPYNVRPPDEMSSLTAEKDVMVIICPLQDWPSPPF